MVSIIKNHNNIIKEATGGSVDNDDIIVKMCDNEIEFFDFNTLERKRVIKSPIWLFQMSVSPCGKFVAGSNEKSNVFVWNILTGELIENIVISDQDCQPVHTFTPDGNLLVGHTDCIYSFSYSSETNTFQKVNTTTIPETGGVITSLKHNSVDMFACGTNTGNIYIFNTNSETSSSMLFHTITEFTKEEVNELCNIDFKNNVLVASSWGQKQICFDLTTNTLNILEKPKFGNYRTPFIVSNLLITPCMKKVIGTYNFYTFIWDLSTGNIDKKLNIDLHTFHAFNPSGSKLIISCRDPIFKIIEWDD